MTTDHEEEWNQRIIKELFADCSPTVQKIIMNAHNKFIPSDEKESNQEDSNGEEDGDELTEEYMSDQTEQERNDSKLTDSQQITVTVFNTEEYDSGMSMFNQPHPYNMKNVSVYH